MLPKNENKHLPRNRMQLSSLQGLHCQQAQSHLLCQHGTHSFPVEYNFPVLQCFYPLWSYKYSHVVTHMRAIYILQSLISRVEHSGVFHKSRNVPKLGAHKKTSNPFVWRVNIKEVPRSINNSVCHRRLVSNNNTLPVAVSIWRSGKAQSLICSRGCGCEADRMQGCPHRLWQKGCMMNTRTIPIAVELPVLLSNSFREMKDF